MSYTKRIIHKDDLTGNKFVSLEGETPGGMIEITIHRTSFEAEPRIAYPAIYRCRIKDAEALRDLLNVAIELAKDMDKRERAAAPSGPDETTEVDHG